jgi:putative ABC transport system permease protein
MAFDIRPKIRRAFQLALRRRDLVDAEVDAELEAHVDLRISQLMMRGLTRQQAEAEARRRFGTSWDAAVDDMKRAGQRRESRLSWREQADALRGDLGYATRTLLRQPGFALVVILTFALGIGANATMFGVIDRLLLQPPPQVRDAQGVFELSRISQADGKQVYSTGLQYPMYPLLRADTSAFRDVAASSFITMQSLGTGAEAEQAYAVLASPNYFRLLGTDPSLGRFFGAPEEEEVATSDVVVLSHGFWQRRFGGDPGVLGKMMHVGPRELTIIGVTREGFTGPDPRRVDMWIPLSQAEVLGMVRAPWKENWGNVWLRLHVRLQPGVTGEAAASRAATIRHNEMATFPGLSKGQLQDMLDGPITFRSILPSTQRADDPQAKLAKLLLGVTVAVLLIACANVASLLLARGTERRREIAVRLALGVSRARLVRLLLAETTLLALIGGALAIAVAHWGLVLLQATLLSDFAWTESALDGRVLAATSALILATVVLAGVVPALRASRPDIVDSLKAGGREGGIAASRLRAGLMMMQATLSVVLIVGASLFVKSLHQAAGFQLGYQTTGVLAGSVDVMTLGYKAPARIALYEVMRSRVAALPGVADAALAATHPLQGWAFGIRVRAPGRDDLPTSPTGGTAYNAVSSQFFTTLGLKIVEGRPLMPADQNSESRVAVLSENMARAFWPNERAVDRCLMLNRDSLCTTVVGVAADAKQGLNGEPGFLVYVPMNDRWGAGANTLVVRARDGDARRLVTPIRQAMLSAAANLPYADVQTLDDALAPVIRPWKTGATLFSLFGALALVIAAMGLYSAISYSVVQRRHEFGVRLALGARIADVVRIVVSYGMRPVAVGIALGAIVAVAAAPLVGSLLFQTSPSDPFAYAVTGVVMLIVAAAASVIPARRAARVDPATALRGD